MLTLGGTLFDTTQRYGPMSSVLKRGGDGKREGERKWQVSEKLQSVLRHFLNRTSGHLGYIQEFTVQCFGCGLKVGFISRTVTGERERERDRVPW